MVAIGKAMSVMRTIRNCRRSKNPSKSTLLQKNFLDARLKLVCECWRVGEGNHAIYSSSPESLKNDIGCIYEFQGAHFFYSYVMVTPIKLHHLVSFGKLSNLKLPLLRFLAVILTSE